MDIEDVDNLNRIQVMAKLCLEWDKLDGEVNVLNDILADADHKDMDYCGSFSVKNTFTIEFTKEDVEDMRANRAKKMRNIEKAIKEMCK